MKVKKITRSIVADAQPAAPGSSYYIMDESLPGFALRVHPKSKLFVVRFKRRPYTIGLSSVFTIEKAREKARQLLMRLWSGEPAADTPTMTVADLFARYVPATEGRKRPLTNRNEGRLWRRHILPELGKLPLSALTLERISTWHQAREATPASANRALAVLRAAVRWAERTGVVPKGSSAGIKADAFPEYPRERVLSSAELNRLGAAMRQAEAAQLVPAELIAVVRLMIQTGARPAEILGARAEWIDWDRWAIMWPIAKGDRPGRKRGRAVWLGPLSMEIVRRYASSGPLFPSVYPKDDEDRSGYNRYERAWSRLCRLANIEGATPYVARHTFISRGSPAGVGIEGSSDLAGHASIEITKRVYHHGEDDEHRKNVAAIELSLDGLLNAGELAN